MLWIYICINYDNYIMDIDSTKGIRFIFDGIINYLPQYDLILYYIPYCNLV